MANWAYTDYAIEGPKEDLQKIEQAILHHPIKENSSSEWEGNVLIALHDNSATWMPKEGRYLRGFINDEPWWDKDDTVLRFSAEEAWGATDFNEELEEVFPNIKVFYTVEEEGEEVYATNDKEGKYFPDRYYADTCINGDYQSEYFITEEAMYKWLSKITNGAVQAEKDAKDFNSYYEELAKDDECFINIHEFTVVD